MILLNVIIGFRYLFYIGAILLITVVLVEWLFLSKYLAGRWGRKKILLSVIVANLLSTLIGLTSFFSYGWHVVSDLIKESIFPPEQILWFFMMMLAFIVTIILEIPLNIVFLKRYFRYRRIIAATLYANIFTYVAIYLLQLFFVVD